MAQAFGVSTTFIDKELASFITAGRIHAKIDKGKILAKSRICPELNKIFSKWNY